MIQSREPRLSHRNHKEHGTPQNGVWQRYLLSLFFLVTIATIASLTLAQVPNPGHSASSIGAGMFGAGDLNIAGAVNATNGFVTAGNISAMLANVTGIINATSINISGNLSAGTIIVTTLNNSNNVSGSTVIAGRYLGIGISGNCSNTTRKVVYNTTGGFSCGVDQGGGISSCIVTYNNTYNDVSVYSAACPSGYKLTGGGCQLHAPQDGGWGCGPNETLASWLGGDEGYGGGEVWAVCCTS